MLEQENRRFFYFYNENFKDTYVDEDQLAGKGLDTKQSMKVYQAYEWYASHFTGLADAVGRKTPVVYLLTSNTEAKQLYQKLATQDLAHGIIDMHEFVTAH